MEAMLPASDYVSLIQLRRLFSDTTTSYKYLFFLALLDEIAEHDAPSPTAIATRDVIVGALALAWYPTKYFRISLGTQDQLVQTLEAVCSRGPDGIDRLRPHHLAAVRMFVDQRLEKREAAQLSRWVPYRLISPWFQEELRGKRDHLKNGLIAKLADDTFHRRRPLYRLVGKADALEVHPDWWVYVKANHTTLREWVLWHWLTYLQPRNPTVPSLSAKLVPVVERASLTRQRSYWRQYVERQPMSCIYTGERLEGVESLDHVLPWSFVAHDRWWNLVPVSSRTNSSKGDAIPPVASIAPDLAELHAKALVESRSYLSAKAWRDVVAEYAEDLRADANALGGNVETTRIELAGCYRKSLPPLAEMALLQGFPSWSGSNALAAT
ncbi:MAG: hypothetical protein H6747_13885 [Deltaproteobacteria bacterium]|nr:hypothetical protein [Deltaproteobacteria bacterium]